MNGENNASRIPEYSASLPRIKLRVAELPNVPYGIRLDGLSICFDPSVEDIRKAIDEGRLEERGFQTDLEALRTEWEQQSQGNPLEFYRLQGVYHARRIAYFVVRGWSDPIVVDRSGNLHGGLHRLKAAKFLDHHEIDAIVKE